MIFHQSAQVHWAAPTKHIGYSIVYVINNQSVCSRFQCCYQFKTAFSTSGYAGILPTLLRVYNQQVSNAVLTQAVEFTCRQFYVMHRTPFVLQLFGSLANYVLIGDETITISDDFYRVGSSGPNLVIACETVVLNLFVNWMDCRVELLTIRNVIMIQGSIGVIRMGFLISFHIRFNLSKRRFSMVGLIE